MGYLALGFFVVVAGLIFFLSRLGKISGAEPEQAKETELTERFFLGRYVQGIPGQKDSVAVVTCGVTDKDFVVFKGTVGDEIARIARYGTTGFDLSKLTDTSYRLELSWVDHSAASQKALFCFEDKRAAEAMANAALESLKKWQCLEQEQAYACNG